MKVVVLAAGAGLGNSRTLNLPIILLRFDDPSLMQRHIFVLKHNGIEELVLGVGFNRGRFDNCVDIARTNAEILPRLSAATRRARPDAMTDVATGRMSKDEQC